MKELSRRKFLQVLGISVTAVAVAPGVLVAENQWADFQSDHEYGDYGYITGEIGEFHGFRIIGDKDVAINYGKSSISTADKVFLEQEVIPFFDNEIERIIPPQYRRKINWMIWQPIPATACDPLGRKAAVGWKYSPRH